MYLLSTNRFIQSFSWTLLHSLWQGLLLAVLAAFVLLLTRKSKATLRYNLLLLLGILFIGATVITFIREWNSSTRMLTGNGTQLPFYVNTATVIPYIHLCINYFSANAPAIVLVWLIIFIFRSIKTMGGWLYAQQARKRYVHTPPVYWQDRLQELCKQLHLQKAVTLLESGYVKIPLVIGHLKPVILMPAGLLTGLPQGQIEAVLLHELAHIRRHDFLVNLLQVLMETVFFFNPGFLWISALLREEREHCCDDAALAQTGNKREFIQALIAFKENTLYGNAYAMAFPGKKNLLLQRVNRILGNKNKTLAPAERTFFTAGILLLSVIMASAVMAQMETVKQTRHITITAIKKVVVDSVPVERHVIVHEKKHVVIEQAKQEEVPEEQPEVNEQEDVLNLEQRVQIVHDRVMAKRDQVLRDDKQADPDRATVDREPAVKGREQAVRDRAAAMKDREQAVKDRAQADLDRVQAVKDRAQADLDRAQAVKDREQAERDRAQGMKDREQAEHDRAQAMRDKEKIQREKERQDRIAAHLAAANNNK